MEVWTRENENHWFCKYAHSKEMNIYADRHDREPTVFWGSNESRAEDEFLVGINFIA
jgi:hypothetical protein